MSLIGCVCVFVHSVHNETKPILYFGHLGGREGACGRDIQLRPLNTVHELSINLVP